MKTSVVAFTKVGAELAKRLADAIGDCTPYAPRQHCESGTNPINGNLQEWTEQAFKTNDGIIFIGACGIAVRAIAPFIKNKIVDPAVIVVDVKAGFSISLLSGHVGGANELARSVAEAIGAEPIITTATDCNDIFSVDEWAVRSGMSIFNPERIKDISGALLNEKQVGLKTQFKVSGKLPEGITTEGQPECGISISFDSKARPYDKTLVLMPMILHLGIGCRKGTSQAQIEEAVLTVLTQNAISIDAIKDISSIDLKEKEPGLLAFCKKARKPFFVYGALQLAEINMQVSASNFVKEITGVDNVCERAALCSAGKNAQLIIPKTTTEQVAVALAAEYWEVTI